MIIFPQQISLGYPIFQSSPETSDKNIYRWARSGAELQFISDGRIVRQLNLDVRPGPGVGNKAFTLEFVDERGLLIQSVPVNLPSSTFTIWLPTNPDRVTTVKLVVQGEHGLPTGSADVRILDFLVSHILVIGN